MSSCQETTEISGFLRDQLPSVLADELQAELQHILDTLSIRQLKRLCKN